jgi:hypothetical protein
MMVKKIGGWGNLILICILIFFLIEGIVKTNNRRENTSYAIGISEGIKKGVRGTRNLYYYFKVDGVAYSGNVPEEFCKKCNDCCVIGDTVQVRYETDNPKNNDLVVSIPGE